MKVQTINGLLTLSAAATLVGGCCLFGGKPANPISRLQTNWLDLAFGVDTAPVFGWQMNCTKTGAAQKSYRILVSTDPQMQNLVWDSGTIESPLSAAIPYTGVKLSPMTRYWWTVEVTGAMGKTFTAAPTFFETGVVDPRQWEGSQWIMAKPLEGGKANPHPAMAVRKIVKNDKAVASAKWYVTGLGVFEAFINGNRVSNLDLNGRQHFDELKPGFTDARKMRQYFSYDVTHLINKDADAENILSAIVTSGWWSDQITGKIGKQDAFRGLFVVNYTDGTQARFGTDTSWDAAFKGPVVKAEIHYGEDFDARESLAWMTEPVLGDGWSKAVANTEFKGRIDSLIGPAVRVRNDLQLRPVSLKVYDLDHPTDVSTNQFGVGKLIREYQDGAQVELDAGEMLVVDFAQNAVGWENLQLSGGEGTKVTIKHSEFLNDNKGLKSRGNDGPEGIPYFRNLRRARAYTTLTLGGKAVENYHPSFSFYGFQYLAITTTAKVTFQKIRADVVTSVLEGTDTGCLKTSNEKVNRLIANCRWGHYGNYLSVPTDCPQRDERLGWTADTQVFTPAAAYGATTYGFLSKFMRDMRDSQEGTEGGYPGVAPYAQYGNNRGHVGWADAGILVPYYMWKAYGDTTILRDNWASMCKYMDYIESKNGPTPHWGDWLAYNPPEHPQKPEYQQYLCAAYYVWDARIMAEMAEAIQAKGDVKRFTEMAEKAKKIFQDTYLEADGTVKPMWQTQTGYLFALMLQLNKDEKSFAATKAALLKRIKDNGDRLETGFLGTSIILNTLTKLGCTDVAYTLLLQENEPSWLYSVNQGATTMWERWNSYTKAKGFGSAGMNSFNHYAYGAVLDWMFNTMAGIRYDPAQPGYRNFILNPNPDRRIGKVRGAYRTPYGRVFSAWEYVDVSGDAKPGWSYSATVPANTTALVMIPCPNGEKVTINGKPAKAVSEAEDGLTYIGIQNGCATFRAGAGSFTAFVQ